MFPSFSGRPHTKMKEWKYVQPHTYTWILLQIHGCVCTSGMVACLWGGVRVSHQWSLREVAPELQPVHLPSPGLLQPPPPTLQACPRLPHLIFVLRLHLHVCEGIADAHEGVSLHPTSAHDSASCRPKGGGRRAVPLLSTLGRCPALGAARFPRTSPALHTRCNTLPLQGATLGHPPSCWGGSEALTVSARKREVESVVFACVQNVLVLHTERTLTLRCTVTVGRLGVWDLTSGTSKVCVTSR